MLEEVMRLMASGAIKIPPPGQRFPLERAAEAMAAALQDKRAGKVLIEG